MSLIDLINNIAWLFALGILYSFLMRIWKGESLKKRIGSGLLFGAVAIAGMLNPMQFSPGIFFDGRSIVIGLAGLFGGPVAAAISAVMACSFRFYLGGAGVIPGVLVIVSSAVIGVAGLYLKRRLPRIKEALFYYFFGFVVHIVMLLCMLALPRPAAVDVLKAITIPVMAIFPLGTLLLGTLLSNVDAGIAAQKAMREAEERFRLFMRHFPGCAFIKDQSGHVTYLNEQCREYFGGKSDVLVGGMNDEFWPGEVAEKIRREEEEALCEGKNVRVIEQFPREGGFRTYLSEKFPILLPESASEVGVVSLDITDLRRAEEEIGEARARLELAVSAANVGLWDWDLESNRVYYSPVWKKQIGYEEDEISDDFEEWKSRVHPEDLGRMLSAIDAYLKNPTHRYEQEFRFRHRDGGYRNILTQAKLLKDGEGKPVRMIGSHVDITATRRIEKELRKRDMLLNETSRMAKIGAWEFDVATRKGTWTEETARIHGLDPSQATGVELGLSFYKGKYRKTIEAAVDEAVSKGKPYDLELLMTDTRGVKKWVRTIAQPVTEGGKVVKVRGIFQDITDRKRAEDQVRKLNEELRRYAEELERRVQERTEELSGALEKAQEAERLKSVFLASMSHELRTPLNAIIGFTGIMLMGLAGDLNAEQKKQLSIVQDNSRHLLDMINDILDISKIEAEKVDLSVESFDFTEVAEEVTESVKTTMDEKGLVLAAGIPAGTTMQSDRRRVKQVLLNLMSNAVKYTEEGHVGIHARRLGGDIEIKVTDTGIGISDENMIRLFQPFQQVDMSLTKRFEGTGLGLYLSKKLTALLGGEITAESTVGKGSTFTVVLPVSVPAGKKGSGK
ncbi:MAG: PAS domain-containing protein [Spirochaetes bacterium]|nr:PAS domain-containing protein [Spirochaetota bacterium]